MKQIIVAFAVLGLSVATVSAAGSDPMKGSGRTAISRNYTPLPGSFKVARMCTTTCYYNTCYTNCY